MMSTATLEDIASWPAPNYVNPDTCVSLVLGVEIPFVLITVAVVVARLLSPSFTHKRSLGLDDWLMAFATV
jgi:hypothetical protein